MSHYRAELTLAHRRGQQTKKMVGLAGVEPVT